MTFTISCVTCGGDFRIPESLFATRFAGRETKIKCKKCGGLIVVDGLRNAPVRASGRPSTPPGRAHLGVSGARVSRPPKRISVTPPMRASSAPLPARASVAPSPARASTPPSPGRASRPPARPSTLSGRRSPLISAVPRRQATVAASKESLGARSQSVPPVAAPTPRASEAEVELAPALQLVALSSSGVASAELAPVPATSTSSASLRAVELPAPILSSVPPELPLSASVANAAPAPSAEAPRLAQAAKAAAARPAAKRAWLVLGAAAVLALGVAFLLRGSPSESSVSASAPPSLTAPALSLESRTPANATEPANEPLPAKPAPREVLVAEPAPAEVVAAPPAASAYNAKALEGALHWGISNAEECHKGGRPAGTVKAVLTFGPAGKILQAQLEGEPIASNPVSKCILSFLRSMMIPAFTGPEFTITREITLR